MLENEKKWEKPLLLSWDLVAMRRGGGSSSGVSTSMSDSSRLEMLVSESNSILSMMVKIGADIEVKKNRLVTWFDFDSGSHDRLIAQTGNIDCCPTTTCHLAPPFPSPSNKNTMSTSGLREDTVLEAIDLWSSDFREALMDRKSYVADVHFQFREDARILDRHLQAFDYPGVTIFKYLNDIFADSVRRGYVDALHHPALFSAFKSWASEVLPPPRWQAPADPTEPPPPRKRHIVGRAVLFLNRPMEKEGQVAVAGPVKSSKGKEKEVVVVATTSNPPGTGAKKPAEPRLQSGGKTAPAVKSAPVVPSESGDEQVVEINNPPCKRCVRQNISCVAQPDGTKASLRDKRSIRPRAACQPCKGQKNRCEFPSLPAPSPDPPVPSPVVVVNDVKAEGGPAAAIKPKRVRKKPTAEGLGELVIGFPYPENSHPFSDSGRGY